MSPDPTDAAVAQTSPSSVIILDVSGTQREGAEKPNRAESDALMWTFYWGGGYWMELRVLLPPQYLVLGGHQSRTEGPAGSWELL